MADIFLYLFYYNKIDPRLLEEIGDLVIYEL